MPRPQEDALQLPCQQVLSQHNKHKSNVFLFRDQTTGKFRPMSEVDGPKFPAERSNRRDFPDTKEEFEEKAGEEDQDN